jgi:prophage regulatory protein
MKTEQPAQHANDTAHSTGARHDVGEPLLRVMRLRQVQDRIGLGRSTIYDRMDPKSTRYDDTFPKPVKLGCSAIGWIESDICRWIEARMVTRLKSPQAMNTEGQPDLRGDAQMGAKI